MNTDLPDLLLNSLQLTPQECAGKVVVVTGAGRGIGEQVARAFAWLNASVVIAEISSQGQVVADDIYRLRGRAIFVQTDFSDSASVQHLVDTVRKNFGPVDI